MRIIDKLVPFLYISLTTAVMAQLPFFLQRLMPKQGLLGSGSSSYPSLYTPLLTSPGLNFSPLSSASSIASLLGAASNVYGTSLPLASQGGSLPFGSSALGSLGLGSSPLPSTNFGSSFLPENFVSSSFIPQGIGSSSSYLPASLGSASFLPSSFGSSSYIPSSGPSSFSSSGLGSPLLSSASFEPQGSASGYSPFASATYNSPTILGSSSLGQRFERANYGSDFGTSGNFDGLRGFDPIDIIEDYPGFSNAGFGKDLNFAGSQTVKFNAPSMLGNEYNSYLKRSSKKK